MSKLETSESGLVLAAGVIAAGSSGIAAQTAPTANGMPAVPTTRVLAIGRVVDGVATEKLMPVMKSEVPETLKLYLAGKIDQWYVRQDKRGVVFVMNVTTVEEAHTLLEKLPLGQAKMMEFDLIPLGPLSPLYRLLGAPAAAPAGEVMQCYCASARQVARRLTRLYEAELRPAGLNPAQFELLANLQGRPGASQAELAHAMDVDQTTLSRNLRLVVKVGWIQSEASAKDGRRIEYRLTSEGSKTLRRAMPCWERAMVRVRESLGSEAQEVFRTLELLGKAAR